jgi:hypothetical protein
LKRERDEVMLQKIIPPLFRKRPRLTAAFVTIAAVYVPARLLLLTGFYHSALFDPLSSDTALYARYAFVYQYAFENRLPFYGFYRQLVMLRDPAMRSGVSPDTSATVICYPPLALAVMNVPAFIVKRDRSIMRTDLAGFTGPYQRLYRLLCMLLECAAVIAVCLIIFNLYKTEPLFDIVFRIAFLCGAGLLMPYVLYDRLDIILGAMVALSLAALLRRSPALSFLMLALAINFKLVPVFLIPVWILGSLRAADFRQPDLRGRMCRLLWTGAARGFVIGGMILAVFMTFFLQWGKGTLGFMSFFDRGVHIESLWGTLSLLVSALAGMPVTIEHGYGAFNVTGPAAYFLPPVSLAVMACAMAGLTAVLFAHCARSPASRAVPEHDGALLSPSLFIMAALAFLLTVFSLSKVFSPQFLLVLVPLAALAPLSTKEKAFFYFTFATTCALSTAIYPFCYFTDIIPRPTAFGLFLLAARALLLAGMTVFIATRLVTLLVSRNDRPLNGETPRPERAAP